MAAENFKVKKGLEVGTGSTITSGGINVTGVITATQFKGDGSGLTGVVASGTGVIVKDEGSTVGTAGTINFVGGNISASLSEGTATVTIDNSTLSSLNVTGVSTFSDDVTFTSANSNNLLFDKSDNSLKFGDSVRAKFGASTDMEIYHTTASGGTNFVKGDGNLTLQSNVIVLEDESGNDYIRVDNGGAVKIHHPGTTEKIRTTSTGVSITGITSTTNLYVTGGANIVGVVTATTFKGDGDFVDIDVDGHTELDDLNVSGITTLGSGGSGSVVLKHGGNQKLITTASGITVPDLNATGVGTVGRLDTSGVTLGTNATTFAAKFADDAVANFGGSDDLKIYHSTASGGNSIINDTGTGNLIIGGSIVEIKNAALSQTQATFTESGAVELYNASTKRFETSGSGVIVTGVCTATSFSGDGSGLTGITASGTGIVVKHDGSTVGTAGTINFSTNLDVSAISAGIVTVTASGGTSGIAGISTTGSSFFNRLNVSGISTFGDQINGTVLNLSSNITATGSLSCNQANIDNQIIINGTQPLIKLVDSNENPDYDIKVNGGVFQIIDSTAPATRFQVSTSGVEVTGVCTATSFSGALAASNLTGTIADDRFPATLPAVSGTNLTSLNADNISSGTLASARIEDNAVTFAKMQDVATNVIIGRNTSGSGDMEALSAADVRTLLNVADGATAGITTDITNVQVTLNLTSSGSNYRLTGPGQDGTENNPDLYLVRGQRYRITHNAGGAHPLQIRLSSGGTAYTDGVTYSDTTYNRTTNGNNLEINLQHDAPARLYYQCTVHGGMVGNIFVVGGPQHIVGVLTATSFSGNGANVTDVNATTLDSIDSGSFLRSDATDICSGQVTFTNQLIATSAGIQTSQTGVALVVNHSTNTAMRGNHFIVDDFPSGGGSYFIQATETNVTNDRNLVLQGYGGKVKIGGQGIAPTEVLDVNGNVKATRFVGSGTSLTNLPADQLTGTIDDARLPNTISSDITGNAASADTVDIGTANANQNYYPVFTETNGSSKTVNIDGGNNLTYNPGTNTLSAVTFSATNVTVTGTLTGATLDIGSSNISSGTHTFTASAGSAVAADTTAVGSCNAIEYTIFVSNSSNIQSQKVLIMDNGTTAYSQEFAVMSNPNMIVTFSADVNSGNVRLLATPETGISGSTTIKFTKMIIE